MYFLFFILLNGIPKFTLGIIFSKYSGPLTDYEVVLPRKVKPCGSFDTFQVKHFFDSGSGRQKRSPVEEVHYRLQVGGSERLLRLRPNTGLVSPGMVVEHWHGGNLSDRRVSLPPTRRCQFHGETLDTGERAALSLCDGMLGHVRHNGTTYLVEPLEEEGRKTGEQLHVIYKRSALRPATCDSSRDWADSWAQEIYRNLKSSKNKTRMRRSRFSEVVPRYMELCVVSDVKFINFHKSRNVDEYVLSIMNMVADLYHDGSIGNLIDIVVVRLVFLHKEKEEIDLDVSPNATTTLEKFCKWQIGLNPKDPNHPNHHDVAVLLTRHDLCSEGLDACGLLGLAYVGTVCNPIRNCCINEDTGLTLAATVAHELGHNMGCAHDSPYETGCAGRFPDGSGTVMAPAVGTEMPKAWSNCSREFITNLLLNQLGECLLNEPKEQNYESPEMPIGAIYDADAQCKLVFGEDFIKCDIGGEKVCELLWCKKKGGKKCYSRGQIVAEGTNCGPNLWCFEKECVPIGMRAPSVDGAWSAWGRWTVCSRTCGGGVSMRERLCINPKPQNGGRYCLGPKRDYRLCNTQDCDASMPTFREVQCTEHNPIPFKGKYHEWSPYPAPESDPNPCALYCINEERTLVKLRPRVKDGTRCHQGSKDTCIHGACMKVGCDWGIESHAVEDICGECNGDGTRCTITHKIYKKVEGSGYVQFTTIPAESTNVAIYERESSENMIAIGQTGGAIFFNGNYTEKSPGEYRMGGVFAVYDKPNVNREEIHIKGPLRTDIVVYYVFFKQENPGVEYKYAFPTSQPSHPPKYSWAFVECEECSVKCGGGIQICKPSCLEEEAGKVADKYCVAGERPEAKTKSCNLQKCRTRWKTWAWGPCSGCMYRTGERRRDVECVMELPSHGDADEIIVSEDQCRGPKPPRVELCNSSRPCNVTGNSASFRKKRWDRHLDENFIKYSYNVTGVEERIKRFCKRSTGHWLSSSCFQYNTSVVLDKLRPSDFFLLATNLTDSNVDLLERMSERDFESVAGMVPQFSADKPVVYRYQDALHKFNKITKEGQVKDLSDESPGNTEIMALTSDSSRSMLSTPSTIQRTVTPCKFINQRNKILFP